MNSMLALVFPVDTYSVLVLERDIILNQEHSQWKRKSRTLLDITKKLKINCSTESGRLCSFGG